MLCPVTQRNVIDVGRMLVMKFLGFQGSVRLRLTKLEIPHNFGKTCIWCYYCNLMCDRIK